MNRDEAKYLLRAYRVGGQDASDPQFREALEMLKHDAELERWFAEEQAIDRRIASKLEKFPVPHDLKAQLLAGRRVLPPAPWWKRPTPWLASAAAVVLLAVSITIWLNLSVPEPFSDFQSLAAEMTASKIEQLDFSSRDPEQIMRWLASRGKAPADFVIPAGLDGRPSLGCCIVDWRGEKVSMICFELENQQMVHLFVIGRARLRNSPSALSHAIRSEMGITTVGWSDLKNVYVLAGKEAEADLIKLL